MERVDAVALLVFCAGVSYVVGWTTGIATSLSVRYSPGLRVWLWGVGLVAVTAVVTVAAAAAWF
ncbi:MAG: hypothetical protein OXG35_05775 [Acidobacteria bacterium]|nr:hypothetical protein [Acidobacteriota bacterium]